MYLCILLGVIILSGLFFRLFGATPNKPYGKMIAVNGVKLHVNASGEKNNKPTLIVEGGGGLSTEYYHWLNEGLKDSMRVIRYDRAGVGYSELSKTTRNSETIAKELHELLEKIGEKPPYIFAGHSLGGAYMRVFAEFYPDEVVGMVFIDATHPEQVERFNAAPKSSFRFRSVIWGLNVATFFGDVGVLGLFQHYTTPFFAAEGLPNDVNLRMKDYLLTGKNLRGYRAEVKNYHSILKRAQKASDFGDIPVRVFTAIEIQKEVYKKRGIDPDKHLQEIIEAQNEFTKLSTNGKQFLIEGNHQTIFTKKENATVICKEILRLTRQ